MVDDVPVFSDVVMLSMVRVNEVDRDPKDMQDKMEIEYVFHFLFRLLYSDKLFISTG